VSKINKNTKGVAMLDHTQWFLTGMLITLSIQLSQPVVAGVPIGKVVQTTQTNSSDAAKKALKEGLELYRQGTAEAKRSAIIKLEEALKLFRVVGDRRGEAATLHNIGSAYSDLGEKQKALESYSQSLPLSRETGNRRGEATTLNNIGLVYSDLGEKQKALEYYSQSLPLSRAVGDPGGEATTLNNIGGVYSKLGEKQKALEYYSQSLPLSRATGDRSLEAITLNNIGDAYSDLGEKQKALEYYSQSLPLFRVVGDRAREALTLTHIGSAYLGLEEKQKALEYYSQSLPLWRAVGDRGGEAATLYTVAYVKRHQNNLTEALNDIESSLKIIENLRTKIPSPELRSSYLATVQKYYEFYINLLMQLHQANPNSGYDIKASEARKRAINP
jgi:tetratricopeptide (TPR) repeat protein